MPMIIIGWTPIEHPKWVHTRFVLNNQHSDEAVDIYFYWLGLLLGLPDL
jgi:hypothetical protein